MAIVWVDKIHGRTLSINDCTITKSKSAKSFKYYISFRNSYAGKIDKRNVGKIKIGVDRNRMYFMPHSGGYKLSETSDGYRISVSQKAIEQNLEDFKMPIGDYDILYDKDEKKYYIDLDQKRFFDF